MQRNWEIPELEFSDSDTRGDRVRLLGIDEAKIDYAIPQGWLDDLVKITRIAYHEAAFVWSYAGYGTFGGPLALSRKADEALSFYNGARHTHWGERF